MRTATEYKTKMPVHIHTHTHTHYNHFSLSWWWSSSSSNDTDKKSQTAGHTRYACLQNGERWKINVLVDISYF
jgi:hypothetical protein